MENYRFTGGTAVLTGAASGIGEQLAYGLAARGSDLILVDRDAEGLARVADAITTVKTETHVVDLADRAAVTALGEELATREIRLLVNNAGVALGGRFREVTLDEFEWVMDINFRAPVVLTHHLLPALTARPGGHLVNVSSLYGLIGPAGQSAYSSSKFAIRGFSEVLRHELAETGTGVTQVHPGGIRTNVARNARLGSGVDTAEAERHRALFAKLLSYPPEKAAAEILDGVEKRRTRVLIASSAKVPDLLARALPGAYGPALDRLTALLTR
ncbi:SDR family NAD(P)-dependent oxidoreductase [Pseudonocardia ailaonensis]|uniref:SDR family NAD(P)-dependent oxidoreductase n=1 Tax=Pseudonocardia ailaonensis TaxID=367279 RepID=A0ABN2NNG3_9PSEU